MQVLDSNEIAQISGGGSTLGPAVAATLGLMAVAATPVVIGVGCVALVGHFFLEYASQ